MINIFVQGMIYGILALGVYMTYRVLDFSDLSVEGSFPLGGAVTALILMQGYSGYLALIVSLLAGMICGLCTGFIHVKLKVRDLLSGIIMMTALYTINLKIASTNNVPLFSISTIFQSSIFDQILPKSSIQIKKLLLLLCIVIICKLLFDWFMKTQLGFLLQAAGDNDQMLTMLGQNKGYVKMIGLSLANGLSALSGSLFVQEQRVFDISMGTGAIVIGLASVILGMSLCKKINRMSNTSAVIVGAVLYKCCIAVAIRFFDPQSMKLITASLFLMILMMSSNKREKKGKKYAEA